MFLLPTIGRPLAALSIYFMLTSPHAAALADTKPDPVLPTAAVTIKPGHPRLLADAGVWTRLNRQRQTDPRLDGFLKQLESGGRALLDQPPVTYQKTGRRLLAVSRRALQRVLLLGFDFRLTGDPVFARRAEREMLAAAAFQDWNPDHFLDVAEMSAALGIGYDWLYDQLSPEARATIRAAIVDKGLRPGLDEDSKTRGWQTVTNNWNSVCYGGLTLAALAVAEDEPALSAKLLQLVRAHNPAGLGEYAPEGVFPEGPMYWSYGTTYQVLLLAALQSATGGDFGLGRSPGFMASAAAYQQTAGPSGLAFNFSDGVENMGIEPALFWFAAQLQQPRLLDGQLQRISEWNRKAPQAGAESNRFLPLAALWWPAPASASPAIGDGELPLHWLGRGENPLAIFRTSWSDPRAMFLALKGGSAALSHAHMDAGSFVFESDGVRWAKDLGMQDYNSLEAQGIALWDRKQNGGRWSVLRLNNFSHNTLTIDGKLHHAEGRATISRFIDEANYCGAQVDLTPIFAGQVTSAKRGFLFRPGEHAAMVDELEGLKPGVTVRWAMVTGAQIALQGETATLTQHGKQLTVQLHGAPDTNWEIGPASAATPNTYDAPNPGLQILIANCKAPPSGQMRIAVTLQPGSTPAQPEPLLDTPLNQWP